MRSPGRIPTPQTAFAAALAALLVGCASRAPRDAAPKGSETKLFAGSTSWLNGGSASCETPLGARPSPPVPPLRPIDPWIGAVGLKFGVVHEYEVGVGLCVPTPGASDVSTVTTDLIRPRQAAVGVWLKLDF